MVSDAAVWEPTKSVGMFEGGIGAAAAEETVEDDEDERMGAETEGVTWMREGRGLQLEPEPGPTRPEPNPKLGSGWKILFKFVSGWIWVGFDFHRIFRVGFGFKV
jgi:hypothetical protein